VNTLALKATPTQPLAIRVLDEPRPRGRRQRREYIYHPSFDDPSERPAILAPMPGAEAYERQRAQVKAPGDVPPELAAIYLPLLNREQEQHLFRKMNFLKHQGARLEAREVEAFLVNCNLRLAVALARRYATHRDNLAEMVSDGHLSLIAAVAKFDFSRGHKFSTYATVVLMKDFSRRAAREKNHRQRFQTGQGAWFFDAAVDARTDERACLDSAEHTRDCFDKLFQLLEFLGPRERSVLRLRLSLDDNGKALSLSKVGRTLGLTKEWVRQVQTRALKKLRNLAAFTNLELP
jgi:RNA polymerase sigma factor (sigma-70 family)